MEIFIAFVAAMGVPSGICGFLFWQLKRDIEKREKQKEDHDKNIEVLMRMVMDTGRANYVLAHATARAIQRIPDAQCNGDMTAALEEAARIQKKEQDFLISQGVHLTFGRD